MKKDQLALLKQLADQSAAAIDHTRMRVYQIYGEALAAQSPDADQALHAGTVSRGVANELESLKGTLTDIVKLIDENKKK